MRRRVHTSVHVVATPRGAMAHPFLSLNARGVHMELAMIGLGRMGANMAERLVRGGHTVRGYDPGEAAAPADRGARAQNRALIRLRIMG